MQHELRVKRVYDEPSAEDGFRILVDRLWPRGVSKDAAQIDLWAKELTPSNEVRKWFHEDSSRYDEFVVKYTAELEERRDEINTLLRSLDQPTLTLVTSTKDLSGGHVAVLKQILEKWCVKCRSQRKSPHRD